MTTYRIKLDNEHWLWGLHFGAPFSVSNPDDAWTVRSRRRFDAVLNRVTEEYPNAEIVEIEQP